MGKMKLWLQLLLSLLLCACSSEPMSNNTLGAKLLQDWKMDSLGCLGLREDIVRSKSEDLNSYLGSPYSVFVESFGAPNFLKFDQEGNEVLYYFVDCGVLEESNSPPLNAVEYNIGATHLIIRTDFKDKIKDIFNVTP